MARSAFSFALGFVAGVSGVLAYQAIRRRQGDDNPENLLNRLGSKLTELESRLVGHALVGTKKRGGIETALDLL